MVTNYSFVPEPHQVFNEFDRIGLLLGLPRLEEERNTAYKQRLLDVFVNRADSTYRGLINGITRELGYSLFQPLVLQARKDVNGASVGTNSAIVFKDTKCSIYADIALNTPYLELDRFDYKGRAYTLQELTDRINETPYFTATLSSTYKDKRSMTIFNQSTVVIVPAEEVNHAGGRVKLQNTNLVTDSIVLRSPNLTDRVSSQTLLIKSGQYYVDPTNGILFCTEAPAAGSVIRYKYKLDKYRPFASPVIIHNLQSDDFKKKMFEQIVYNNEVTNGLPTELGAEIINELLSVFPTSFGG